MTEIIRQYINRYYDNKPVEYPLGRNPDDARKLQAINEYLEMDKSVLFCHANEPIGLRKLGTGKEKNNIGLLNSFLQLLLHLNDFVDGLSQVNSKDKYFIN